MSFSLGGDFGLDVLAAGSPSSAPAACASGAVTSTADPDPMFTAGASTLAYDPVTETYSYVWKTDKAMPGMCRTFTLTFNDGTAPYGFQFIKSRQDGS